MWNTWLSGSSEPVQNHLSDVAYLMNEWSHVVFGVTPTPTASTSKTSIYTRCEFDCVTNAGPERRLQVQSVSFSKNPLVSCSWCEIWSRFWGGWQTESRPLVATGPSDPGTELVSAGLDSTWRVRDKELFLGRHLCVCVSRVCACSLWRVCLIRTTPRSWRGTCSKHVAARSCEAHGVCQSKMM